MEWHRRWLCTQEAIAVIKTRGDGNFNYSSDSGEREVTDTCPTFKVVSYIDFVFFKAHFLPSSAPFDGNNFIHDLC